MSQRNNTVQDPSRTMRIIGWFTPARRIVIVFTALVLLNATLFVMQGLRDGWSAPATPWMLCVGIGVLAAMRTLAVQDRNDAPVRARVIGALVTLVAVAGALIGLDLLLR